MAVDPAILAALNVNIAANYGVVIDPQMLTVPVQMNTPTLDRLEAVNPRMVQLRQTAVYGLLTAADFSAGGAASFAAGGDPYGIEPTRALYSTVKKSYGASGGVKDIDIITSAMPGAPISLNAQQFRDDAAMLLQLLYIRTRRGINMDMVKGDKAAVVTAFDGIETLLSAATIPAAFQLDVADSEFEPAMLDELVVRMISHGVLPTAIYCSPIMHKGISDAYQSRSGTSINISDNQTGATTGVWITRVVTPAGELPIVSDPFYTVTSSGGAGAYSVKGAIRVVTEQFAGVPVLYPEWQVLPTAIPLSKVMGRGRATSTELAVWAHLCLVDRSHGYAHGIINNVTVTSKSSWSAATA